MDDITWPEARGILQELVTVFESNDDIESIKEVRSLMGMVEEAYEWKEESAKKIIQETGASSSASLEEITRRSEAVQSQRNALLAKLKAIRDEKGAASSQLSNLREDFLKVREESRRLKELEAKVITTKRRFNSLYFNISHILWQLDGKGFTGTVSKPGGVPPVSFSFPPDTPKFELANSLWEKIM